MNEMHGAMNGEVTMFSVATEQFVTLCGQGMPLTNYQSIFLDPRKRTFSEKIKTQHFPPGVDKSIEFQSKLLAQVSRFEDTPPSQIYVQLDSIGKTPVNCSTDPFDGQMCVYCHTKSKFLMVEGREFGIIPETRGDLPFYRICLRDHLMPKELALHYMELLQAKYKDLAFFIPLTERYGCSMLRAVNCAKLSPKLALDRYVLMMYEKFKAIKFTTKEGKLKVKWPIVLPLTLLSGRSRTIAESAVECLATGRLDVVGMVETKIRGKVEPTAFVHKYIPDSALIAIADSYRSRKGNKAGSIQMYRGYAFETIELCTDLSQAGLAMSAKSICFCGYDLSESKFSLTAHFEACPVHLERGLICLCGEEFSKMWAYADHVTGCPKSVVNGGWELSLKK